jgi:amino acid permease
VVPHIVNAVILVSVLSVGNASTFAASRTLEALAEIGQAPRWFAYIDKKGRPLATLALVLALGPLAFIGAYDGGVMFDWLFGLCGLSSFFTWYVARFQWVLNQGFYMFCAHQIQISNQGTSSPRRISSRRSPIQSHLGGFWLLDWIHPQLSMRRSHSLHCI